jgi:hypothetical protein
MLDAACRRPPGEKNGMPKERPIEEPEKPDGNHEHSDSADDVDEIMRAVEDGGEENRDVAYDGRHPQDGIAKAVHGRACGQGVERGKGEHADHIGEVDLACAMFAHQHDHVVRRFIKGGVDETGFVSPFQHADCRKPHRD